MQYLLVIFLPWLYFFVNGRLVVGTIHLILWLISIPLAFVGIGVVLWAVLAGHASFDLRKRLMRDHAADIARNMVSAMQANTVDSR